MAARAFERSARPNEGKGACSVYSVFVFLADISRFRDVLPFRSALIFIASETRVTLALFSSAGALENFVLINAA